MIDSIHFFFITLKYRFHFCFLPVAIKIIPSIKRTIQTGRLITNSTTQDNKIVEKIAEGIDIITARSNERIIVEPSIDEPIKITL